MFARPSGIIRYLGLALIMLCALYAFKNNAYEATISNLHRPGGFGGLSSAAHNLNKGYLLTANVLVLRKLVL